MPPKRKRGATSVDASKSSATKKSKASDEPPKLKKNFPVLYVECCRSCSVFKRRAEALHREIVNLLTPLKSNIELQLCVNSDGPPRRGAFEVAISMEPSDDVDQRNLIWTGIKRTPRAQKFPAAEDMAEVIKKHLKLVSSDVSPLKQEESEQDEPDAKISTSDEEKPQKSSYSKGGRSKK
uniref:Selenoprotein BthD n=1 Tax=Stomoxys calcitrans TaxID=35570 RepID=A0A1I8PKZ5_STOCA